MVVSGRNLRQVVFCFAVVASSCGDDSTNIDAGHEDITEIVDVTNDVEIVDTIDDLDSVSDAIVDVVDAVDEGEVIDSDGGLDAVEHDDITEIVEDTYTGPRRCNGHPALCDRTLREVALAGTHNAMSNAEQRFAAPNQNRSIAHQLEDGIRAMLIDTYIDDGDLLLCHGTCGLGSSDAVEQFSLIRDFLLEHPNDVFVFILEDHIDFEDTERLLAASGIDDMLFAPPPASEPWPTLAQMIDSGQRVLVTLESGDGDEPAIAGAWDVFFETPYSFEYATDFVCSAYRGSDDNALFLLNHWLGRPLPLPAFGAEVNAYDVLYARATACADERGQIPNVIAVDFHDLGDLFEVVDVLNGVREPR